MKSYKEREEIDEEFQINFYMNGNIENENIFFFSMKCTPRLEKKLNCKVFENGKILDFDKKFDGDLISLFLSSLSFQDFFKMKIRNLVFSQSE